MKIIVAFLVFNVFYCLGALPINVTQIIQDNGYPCEQHEALTPDGWYLSIQRIPHGRHNTAATKGVVFFQHGLTDSSVGVCLNNPEESLVFILADAGYDVWLGNNRGNGYSMKNIHYQPSDAEFWDFSWDDMAASDLPTHINYVLSYTGVSKLSYIGHSEGTTQAFAGFILNNTLAESINVFIALAPVAFVSHTSSPVVKALADLPTQAIFDLLGVHEFYLSTDVAKLIPGVCRLFPTLCDFDLELIMGPSSFVNASRISFYGRYEPNPTSVKNMAHWGQQVNKGTFSMYDYGTQGNIQHYNQPNAPQYEFNNFPKNLPTVFFTGGEDYLADPTDVANLLALIPPPFVHNEPEYAHLDFIMGENANTRIYPLLQTFLEKYQ